jgi:hypothetical protein
MKESIFQQGFMGMGQSQEINQCRAPSLLYLYVIVKNYQITFQYVIFFLSLF